MLGLLCPHGSSEDVVRSTGKKCLEKWRQGKRRRERNVAFVDTFNTCGYDRSFHVNHCSLVLITMAFWGRGWGGDARSLCCTRLADTRVVCSCCTTVWKHSTRGILRVLNSNLCVINDLNGVQSPINSLLDDDAMQLFLPLPCSENGVRLSVLANTVWEG